MPRFYTPVNWDDLLADPPTSSDWFSLGDIIEPVVNAEPLTFETEFDIDTNTFRTMIGESPVPTRRTITRPDGTGKGRGKDLYRDLARYGIGGVRSSAANAAERRVIQQTETTWEHYASLDYLSMIEESDPERLKSRITNLQRTLENWLASIDSREVKK